MEIHEQRQGAVTVVQPKGPLTGQDADVFQTRLREVTQLSLGRFVIDASQIPFVDSRGLEVLKEVAEALLDSGQVVRLSGTNETVREVLDLTELSPLYEHYSDVQSAVRSFM